MIARRHLLAGAGAASVGALFAASAHGRVPPSPARAGGSRHSQRRS